MSDESTNNDLQFDLPKNQSSVIKVLGVGGGGSNAVNFMKSLGIKDVNYVICNTDSQALESSPVENRIQLGVTLTEGLGAGANPDIGKEAAIESLDQIEKILGTNTKMLFVTAGMGGGTGTGAAPIIAKLSQELGLLTVGVVTMPFTFEGKGRMKQAEKGLKELRKYVDSLIIIKNDKLREVYGNLGFKKGFQKADEVLATAVKAIAEVITHHYKTNIDLKDAKTVLANSGTAIMGSAVAGGENRATLCTKSALDSPLLNDNDINGAKNVLLLIVSGHEDHEITVDEIGEINEYIQNEAGGNTNIILGMGEDPSLDDKISVTIIATGFEGGTILDIAPKQAETIKIPLDAEIKEIEPVKQKKINPVTDRIRSSEQDRETRKVEVKQTDLFTAVKEAEEENRRKENTEIDSSEYEIESSIESEDLSDEIVATDFEDTLQENEVVFEVTRTSLYDDEEDINEEIEAATNQNEVIEEEDITIESSSFDLEEEEEISMIEQEEFDIDMEAEKEDEEAETEYSSVLLNEEDEDQAIVAEAVIPEGDLENEEEESEAIELNAEFQNQSNESSNEDEVREEEKGVFEMAASEEDAEEESSFIILDEEEFDAEEDALVSETTSNDSEEDSRNEPDLTESTFETFGLDMNEFTMINDESDDEEIISKSNEAIEERESEMDPINFSIEEMIGISGKNSQAKKSENNANSNSKNSDINSDSVEEKESVRHSLDELIDLEEKLGMRRSNDSFSNKEDKGTDEELDGFQIKEISKSELETRNESANPLENSIEEAKNRKNLERVARLKEYNFQFKRQEDSLNEPAYKRAGIDVQTNGLSDENKMSRMTIGNKEDNGQIKNGNSFLHDNVD